MENKIVGRKLFVYADRAIYSPDVITKCLYWYGDRFRASFRIHSEEYYEITIEPTAANYTSQQLEEAFTKLQRDLIDFRLRETVNIETKTIKELLVAKAFSRFDVDDSTAHDYRDPVQKKQNLPGASSH